MFSLERRCPAAQGDNSQAPTRQQNPNTKKPNIKRTKERARRFGSQPR